MNALSSVPATRLLGNRSLLDRGLGIKRAITIAVLWVAMGGCTQTQPRVSHARPADPTQATLEKRLEAMSDEDAKRLEAEARTENLPRRDARHDRGSRQRIVDQPRIP